MATQTKAKTPEVKIVTGPTFALSVILSSQEIEKIVTNCLNANIPSPIWAANSLNHIKKDLKRDSLYLDDRKTFSTAEWRKKIAGKSPWKKQTSKALADASAAIESRIKQEMLKARYNQYSLIVA